MNLSHKIHPSAANLHETYIYNIRVINDYDLFIKRCKLFVNAFYFWYLTSRIY